MLRIPIFDWFKNEVTEMRVKGWHISIYRDLRPGSHKGKVTLSKGHTEFVLTQIDENLVELEKWVDKSLVETKPYRADGVDNCQGTVYINDHSDPRRCYAFWRSQELQELLDAIGVERLTFSKTDNSFEYELPKTSSEGYDFITDGKITEEEGDMYHVFDATYLLKDSEVGREKRIEKELILSREYNVEQLSKELLG